MGISILELVIRRLRAANIAADIAYPGQKFPQLTDVAAAVHIEKVDRSGMTVTLEVSILCPAAMGGTTCELEALRATETLRRAGAVCVQNGCAYDGVAQVYTVQILATFIGVTDAENCTIWPGFHVYINDFMQTYVVSVSEEEDTGLQPEYVMGETAMYGISQGEKLWKIRLEELIPAGTAEQADAVGDFVLEIVSDTKRETYTGCRWTAIHREFTKDGLRRIRSGFARTREEVV